MVGQGGVSGLVSCRSAERYHELAVNVDYGSLGDGRVEVVAFSVRPEGLRLLYITVNICACNIVTNSKHQKM